MTPEEAAQHNATAPHAAQARACPSCGRYHTTPGWAGWRRSTDGVDYARTGYCSEQCLTIDDPDSSIDPARLYAICQHLAAQAFHARVDDNAPDLVSDESLLLGMAAKIDAGFTLSLIERRELASIARALQDNQP